MADIEKTQLSNDDRALWNPYLSRAAEMVRALTNVERRNQKRRERTRQTVEPACARRANCGELERRDERRRERLRKTPRTRGTMPSTKWRVNQRREWFGSSRATLQETEIVARKQRVCKPLIIKQAR